MKVGDLVQISVESIMSGMGQESVEGFGVIVRDHSPMRPPGVGRIVDVLWDDGQVEEHSTNDLFLSCELSDDQLENVIGGMSRERFGIRKATTINETR